MEDSLDSLANKRVLSNGDALDAIVEFTDGRAIEANRAVRSSILKFLPQEFHQK